jgi:rod shape-determining protein MreD
MRIANLQRTIDSKRLDLVFIASLLLTIVTPALFPSVRFFFFMPFLVMAAYQKPLPTCIWLAFLCGFLIDLFSSDAHLGLYACAYCAAMFALYPQKRHFFADSLSTLPMMCFFFSSFSSLVLALLLYNVELINIFSWKWLTADLLLMPMADALYAFCLFILPAQLLGKPARKGKDYFLIE